MNKFPMRKRLPPQMISVPHFVINWFSLDVNISSLWVSMRQWQNSFFNTHGGCIFSIPSHPVTVHKLTAYLQSLFMQLFPFVSFKLYKYSGILPFQLFLYFIFYYLNSTFLHIPNKEEKKINNLTFSLCLFFSFPEQ